MSDTLIDRTSAEDIHQKGSATKKAPTCSYMLTSPNLIFSVPPKTEGDVRDVGQGSRFPSIPSFNESECHRRGRFLLWPVYPAKSQPRAKQLLEEVVKSTKSNFSTIISNEPSIAVDNNSTAMMNSSSLLDEVMSWDVPLKESLNPCNLGSPDLIITCTPGDIVNEIPHESIAKTLYLPVPLREEGNSERRGRFLVWPVDCSKPMRVPSAGKLVQNVVKSSKIELWEFKPRTKREMIALMEIGSTENADWVAYRIGLAQRKLVQLRIWLSFREEF